MRSLFIQFSALIGVLTLANRLTGQTGAIDAGLAALGAATAMYIVLAVGDWAVRRALDFASQPETAPALHADASTPASETPAPPAEPTSALAA